MSTAFRVRSLVSALGMALAMVAVPARADLVLLGSDYFETIQPTTFTPLGAANPLAGLAIGPGTTDTIVQRRQDCSLTLGLDGSSCTIPIEMVALSLISVPNPMIRVRESPTVQSLGEMTITSDGTGGGGTFDSFFDIFVELSFDGGSTWTQPSQISLSSSATPWTTIESGLLVDGLVGDQDANRHTDKATNCPPASSSMVCVDFFLAAAPGGGPGTVTEQHPGVGIHTARHPGELPEPGSLVLVGLGLLLAAATRERRRAR